jgi:hypothetical protein
LLGFFPSRPCPCSFTFPGYASAFRVCAGSHASSAESLKNRMRRNFAGFGNEGSSRVDNAVPRPCHERRATAAWALYIGKRGEFRLFQNRDWRLPRFTGSDSARSSDQPRARR